MNINYFMSLAYKEAEKGYLLNEVPVGAILVDNATNSVISSAYNQFIKHKNSTKHAEMLLIETGCKKKDSKYLVNLKVEITGSSTFPLVEKCWIQNQANWFLTVVL